MMWESFTALTSILGPLKVLRFEIRLCLTLESGRMRPQLNGHIQMHGFIFGLRNAVLQNVMLRFIISYRLIVRWHGILHGSILCLTYSEMIGGHFDLNLVFMYKRGRRRGVLEYLSLLTWSGFDYTLSTSSNLEMALPQILLSQKCLICFVSLTLSNGC